MKHNKYASTQQLFLKTLTALKIETPLTEYRFHPTRRWRFDFFFPEAKLALEIEGGIWVNGRHNRASGFLKDAEKYNEAAIMGYSLLRVTWEQVASGDAILLIERFIKENKNNFRR